MALSVNTNVMSLAAQRNLSRNTTGLQTAIERLSSGLRVNSAKDDAAGLAIATRIDAQVRGLNVAIRNAGDAISLAQTAEGGLSEITNMLQRMRELAVQSANATNSSTDRVNLNAEYQALNTEITRQIGATSFNGIAVLNSASTQSFQVGANANQTIDVTTSVVSAGAEPIPVGHQQPVSGSREPGGCTESYHGRRFRDGNGQPDTTADSAAGRHGDGRPGQRGTAVSPVTAAVMVAGRVAGQGRLTIFRNCKGGFAGHGCPAAPRLK